MKKVIYISGSSSIIIILLVLFYFNIAGGKEGSELKYPESQTENSLQSIGRVEQSNSLHSGGWQLQVMPNMGSRLVRDLYFTDSLTGYAVASPDAYLDSAHILKTTNGGNNWSIKATYGGRLKKIKFVNELTGYAGGNKFLKTTNAGENWMIWNWTVGRIMEEMFVVSEDTIWYGDTEPIYGGAFRTTNGGLNWEKRDNGIPANSYPNKIYFYNSRIGFAYHVGNPFGHRTTNGGENWFQTDSGFIDIHFNDSLIGFRSWNNNGIQKTTNSGINWIDLSMPNVQGLITNKQILKFIIINKDTIYAVGAYVQRPDFSYRALVYKTTNMGLNWNYLYPDTGFAILRLTTLYAVNNNVWAYSQYNNKGIYSITGGGISKIKDISNENLLNYNLSQNYPNPFNSSTIIQFKVPSLSFPNVSIGGYPLGHLFIKLVVYDISGKEVRTLVNGKYHPGTYQVRFDAGNLSSGVYFLRILVNEGKDFVYVKKMVLIK